jgi:Ca-activated chloride channel family protein
VRTLLAVFAAVLTVAACVAGCDDCRRSSDGDGGAAKADDGSVKLVFAYGSEKETWIKTELAAFEASGARTASGKPIHVEGHAMGSGEALQAIVDGKLKPHVFSPASSLYDKLLDDAWMRKTGKPRKLAGEGEALVLSPVVIAMWRPMAEALGWPNKQLSWSDLLAVSTNPAGWSALGVPQGGAFKFGHCHPEYSNSGFLAVLAEAYAGAKKTRDLTAADVDAPGTRALLTAVESTIVHYGKSTGFFADKMVERGPSYLSAAVLYENLVIESYGKSPAPAPPLVAIYPLEGTFWSDHPFSVLDADWVGPEEKDAGQKLLAFLKARPAQQKALELGFRPGDPSIAIAAPIDAAHGVDPKQPSTVLPVPDVTVLNELLDVWHQTKKGADVILVFDKSGSMNGAPMDQARKGAESFFARFGHGDELTLMPFDSVVYPPLGPLPADTGLSQLDQRLASIEAGGGTSLYDAVDAAYALSLKHAKSDPGRAHAVVVMTDGADENSRLTLDELSRRFPPTETPVRVFTIAYGADAQTEVLARIANAARGSFAKGTVDSIGDVYLDMASFF